MYVVVWGRGGVSLYSVVMVIVAVQDFIQVFSLGGGGGGGLSVWTYTLLMLKMECKP